MRNRSFDAPPKYTLSTTSIVLVCVLGVAFPSASLAQRHPGDNKRLPCAAQPNQKMIDLGTRRDYRTCRYQGNLAQPELSARGFLKHYADVLGMDGNLADIETVDTRRGLATAHTRFRTTLSRDPGIRGTTLGASGPRRCDQRFPYQL